jgi:hypothetical protein
MKTFAIEAEGLEALLWARDIGRGRGRCSRAVPFIILLLKGLQQLVLVD